MNRIKAHKLAIECIDKIQRTYAIDYNIVEETGGGSAYMKKAHKKYLELQAAREELERCKDPSQLALFSQAASE